MIIFWIAALGVAVAALGLIAVYAARPVLVDVDPARAVYRRQLSEIDDLFARGLLGEEERKSAYAESARRLLAEGEASPEETTNPKSWVLVGGGVAAAALIAIVAYLFVGHPGMSDMPYKARLAEWRTQNMQDLTPPQIVALLEEVKKETPNDPELLSLLAEMQFQSGNPLAAQRNLEKAIQIDPANPTYVAQLGEVQVEVAEGEVTPEARATLQKALVMNPQSIIPRYLLGKDLIDQGRRQEGLDAWRALLPDLTPEQKASVEQDIAQVEQTGSTAPAAVSAADNPQVVAMVEGLAVRLEAEPDDPEGWARLVRSYGVLGDTAAQGRALTRARELFKDRPRDLAAIEAAADLSNSPQ